MADSVGKRELHLQILLGRGFVGMGVRIETNSRWDEFLLNLRFAWQSQLTIARRYSQVQTHDTYLMVLLLLSTTSLGWWSSRWRKWKKFNTQIQLTLPPLLSREARKTFFFNSLEKLWPNACAQKYSFLIKFLLKYLIFLLGQGIYILRKSALLGINFTLGRRSSRPGSHELFSPRVEGRAAQATTNYFHPGSRFEPPSPRITKGTFL